VGTREVTICTGDAFRTCGDSWEEYAAGIEEGLRPWVGNVEYHYEEPIETGDDWDS